MIRHAGAQSTAASAISRPGGTGSIDVGADGGKISHVTGGHALEWGLASEEGIRTLDPAIRKIRLRVHDLKGFPDAGDVADPAKCIFRDASSLTLLPLIKSSFGRRAKKSAGDGVVDAPMIHDAEEAFESQSLSVDGHPLGNSLNSS